jgi:pimeloyl-ACP methyl ester carboxylesterase
MPVVLLHGVALNSVAWGPLPDRLGDVRTIAIDLPGHGFSDDLPRYDLAVVADMLQLLVAHLGVREPLVVGHSLGAVVATMYAARHPTRGVVNIDQFLRVAPLAAYVKANESNLKSDDFYGIMEDVKATFGLGVLEAGVHRLVDACWNPRPASVLGYWDLMFTVPGEAIEEQLVQMLRSIPCPYHTVLGSPVPEGYERWLHDVDPRIRLHTFSGAGHFPHLAEPDRFAALIRSLHHQTE